MTKIIKRDKNRQSQTIKDLKNKQGQKEGMKVGRRKRGACEKKRRRPREGGT